jgi:hypothetical protein
VSVVPLTGVQFNPKIMIYDVYGSGTAQISYFDPDSNVHLVSVPLPWSITLSRRCPASAAASWPKRNSCTGRQPGPYQVVDAFKV